MTYKPVKKKMTNLKNRPKFYSGEMGWMLQKVGDKKKTFYGSIAQLAKDNKELSFESWRNLSKGNSDKWKKVYKLVRAKNPNQSQ